MKAHKNIVVLLIAFVLLVSFGAFGQAISGDLVGSVTDQSGAVVPNATVSVLQVSTGVTTQAKTNASGDFRFTNLPVGSYNITVTASGFKTAEVKDFHVELNQTVTAKIQVQVGQVDTVIEVTDVAPAIDTTTAQLQNTFETQEVQNLPGAANNTGSGVLNLALLDAGVGTSGGLGMGSGPSVSGQRPRNNNFTVEGVDDNAKTVTGPLIVVPNDAVQNFTVLQNQFSPEFGHSNGGQFNQVVKSGSNGFHGMGYEYLQNRNLDAANLNRVDANDPTTAKHPRYDNNRFGGNFGGPIIKNKAFFFVDYEYNPIGQAAGATSFLAPTAAGIASLNGMSGLSATNLKIFEQYVPVASSQSGTTKVNGVAIPIGSVQALAPSFTNNKTLVTSGDVTLSGSDQLRVRYLYFHQAAIDTTPNLSTFFTTTPTLDHLASISEYHTFSPTATNELRLGFNRFATLLETGNFSFPGLDKFPNLTFNDLSLQIGPDPNGPQFTVQNLYQLIDNFGWTKGSHNFKFGGELRKYISPQQFTQRSRGDYNYSTLDLYLRDIVPDQLGERSTGNSNYYGDQIGSYFYANDTWKALSNLSVNLGLRYEYTTIPFTERQQKLNAIANVPGVLTFNEPRAPKNQLMPRVGLAWSPHAEGGLRHWILGSSGDSSIRAGFGMGYDVLYDNIGILSLPPEFGSTVDVNLSCAVTSPLPASCQNFLKNGGIGAGGSGITTFPNAAAAIAATSNHVVEQQKNPYSEQWNFGIERAFAKEYSLEVRYVGTRGIHLNTQERINVQSRISPTQFLPTYLTAPTQVQLDALPVTLPQLTSKSIILPAYANAGFTNPIVQFTPNGSSIYHGLQTQLNRRFERGLLVQAAYTWSKTIDDSTADFFSTVLTPRRPQDFQNLTADRSLSPLSRAHRVTVAALWDTPWFNHSGNWFLKNVAGNFELGPVYTYESPEPADVQSAADSNLNGDSAGDRAIFNASGIAGTGSDVTALKNSAGATVAYLATNPNAQYIKAGPGALATAGRDTLFSRPINNWDMTTMKKFNFGERYQLQFHADFYNFFNHPQYVPGSINDVRSVGDTSNLVRTALEPQSANFEQWQNVFLSNGRVIQLALKFAF